MKKRLFSLLLAAMMLFSILPSAQAAPTPASSTNMDAQTYHHGRMIYDYENGWYTETHAARAVRSHLFSLGSSLCRVEAIPGSDAKIVVETYSKDGAILSQRVLPQELSLFGGFFNGEDSYFFVFGQQNPDLSDDAEVVRVVKYSKDWERLSSVSLYGQNTELPFRSGSLRMAEDAAYLYVHTSHRMYNGHQANLTFAVRKSDMTVTDVRSSVMNEAYGYVSHSFNQFLLLDGGCAVTLDHGDAYPRSATLYRCRAINANGRFLPTWGAVSERVDLMTFRGETGDNTTGASLGGFAATASHFVAAGFSVDQTNENLSQGSAQRNIFISAVPKNDLSSSAVRTFWLTDYPSAGADKTYLSTPHLVSLSDGRLIVLWTVDDQVYFRFLNADGSPQGSTYSAPGALSDCVPVEIDGALRWYVTFGSVPEFYTLSLDSNTLMANHTPETANAREASCTEDGYTGDQVCSNCGLVLQEGKAIPATGHHAERMSVREASCTAVGYTGDLVCTDCGRIVEYGASIPAKGHRTELRNARAASCTAAGYTGDMVCTVCGETVQRGSAISAKGHVWDGGKVTKKPTQTAEGVKTFTCTVCGQTRTEPVAKLAPTPTPTPTAKPTTTPAPTAKPDAQNPFKDVAKDQYYYAPVLWAVKQGITQGTSATMFSPAATCTRGQVVTFLWRAAGEPKPAGSKNPFTDVKSGDYFCNAVLWAVEQGITQGTSKTTFSPNAPCTRAHVVTFLWRSEGQNKVDAKNPFKDVKSGDYYYSAVLWAVKNEITAGTSATTFSPASPCTRGQIVTFLYRDLGR